MKSKVPEIIVIDDAPGAAKDFADLIEAQTGLDVQSFVDSNELLEYIAHANVKVAILDQVMPGIRGTELFEKIKDIDPNIRAIMLTGEASKDEVIKAMNSGFSLYLSKGDITQLPHKVLEVYTQYEVSISKKLKNETSTNLFPFWKRLISPYSLVSCTPYGSPEISDEGECILDIYEGEEKEWNSSLAIENKTQIEKKSEQKLATEFSLSSARVKNLASNINTSITTQFSRQFTSTAQHNSVQKRTYKIPQHSTGNGISVSRRVIEQFPIFQYYHVVIRKMCRWCKQAKYISIIVSKQTNRIKTQQTDYMSDNSKKIIDLGIHSVSKHVNPRD